MEIALDCFAVCTGYVIGQVIYMKFARDKTIDWLALPITMALVLILHAIINCAAGAQTIMDMKIFGTIVVGCLCGHLISMKFLGRQA